MQTLHSFPIPYRDNGGLACNHRQSPNIFRHLYILISNNLRVRLALHSHSMQYTDNGGVAIVQIENTSWVSEYDGGVHDKGPQLIPLCSRGCQPRPINSGKLEDLTHSACLAACLITLLACLPLCLLHSSNCLSVYLPLPLVIHLPVYFVPLYLSTFIILCLLSCIHFCVRRVRRQYCTNTVHFNIHLYPTHSLTSTRPSVCMPGPPTSTLPLHVIPRHFH